MILLELNELKVQLIDGARTGTFSWTGLKGEKRIALSQQGSRLLEELYQELLQHGELLPPEKSWRGWPDDLLVREGEVVRLFLPLLRTLDVGDATITYKFLSRLIAQKNKRDVVLPLIFLMHWQHGTAGQHGLCLDFVKAVVACAMADFQQGVSAEFSADTLTTQAIRECYHQLFCLRAACRTFFCEALNQSRYLEERVLDMAVYLALAGKGLPPLTQ